VNAQDHDQFWQRYDREVRPAVERACRQVSRLHADNTMEPGDMASWVHTRVWRMLEKQAFPTFHDNPSADLAIERLANHAPTLARWSYMALARKHWRQMEREAPSELGRVEHLSVTRRADAEIEHREQIDDALAKVRAALPDSVRQKLAASMQDKNDRRRAALALGATRREDDRLINQIDAGLIKENTVQQMRSRARRHAADALGASIRLPLILLAATAILFTASPAEAGEQSGGRRGGKTMTAPAVAAVLAETEQTGGRAAHAPHAPHAPLILARGEQSGGRGGKG
jgi:hypothetical protein